MTHLGKGIEEKSLKKVSDYLSQWLDSDEVIIGVFKASRWNPPSEGFVMTNHRLLLVDRLIFKTKKLVGEIAADDILEFSSEKGLMKARKTYVIKKDGTKVYLGSMHRDDSLNLVVFLPKLSGAPQPIAEKMSTAKIAESVARKNAATEAKLQKLQKKENRKLKIAEEREAKNPAKIQQKKNIGILIDDLQKNATIREMRSALNSDKAVLLTIIVRLIKKHRKTLENKFEQYREEDDYGNSLVDAAYRNEVVYFSDRVVLPELERCIADGGTKYKDIVLILWDLTIFADKEYMPMDISYEDSDLSIVNKLLLAMRTGASESIITDDMLRQIHSDNTTLDSDLKGMYSIITQINLIEPYFGEKIESTSSMDVSRFSASVFIIFSTMYNNIPANIKSKDYSQMKDFVGNDPYKYEEYVKEILRNKGFQTRKTRNSGDFGVDVLASKNGKSYAIQCKLYNRPVGTKAIQEIVSGRLHYRADYALVVSDNKFTEAAKSLARSTGVTLTHHRNLLRNIESHKASQDQTHTVNKLDDQYMDEVGQKPTTKNEWTQDDADELVTVILPTISNGQK